MSATKREGWSIFAMGCAITVASLLYVARFGLDWAGGVALFCGGASAGLAFGVLLIMRQRLFWNTLYGRDLWDTRGARK